MRILVDRDNVLADFERSVLQAFQSRHPERMSIPLEQRTTFHIQDQYPIEVRPLIEEIYLSQGFYAGLPPVPGSLEALFELGTSHHETYICTSPLLKNPYCIPEKYEWVRKHLGKEWVEKIIVCKDKTIIQGDVLIDDKPEVSGVQQPTWEHILHSQPYNRHVTSKKRLDWQNWRSVLNL